MWRCPRTRVSLLPRGEHMAQNPTRVISGRERGPHASLHPMARAGTVSATRSRGVLPREGGFIERGKADLRRLSGSHRVPQLRPSPRRAVRGVGRDERTRTATPEAHGVLSPRERGGPMSPAKKRPPAKRKTAARKTTAKRKVAAKKATAKRKVASAKRKVAAKKATRRRKNAARKKT